MKSSPERKFRLAGRGKSISGVENCSQVKAKGPKNPQGTDGIKVTDSKVRALGGKCLVEKT